MTKKLCTAGVRGLYSYVIVDGSDTVVASIQDDEGDVNKTTHLDMDVAERWVDNHLEALIGKQYEID